MGMSLSAEVFWGYDLGGMVDDDYESIGPAWWQQAQESDDGVVEGCLDELARRLGWVEAPFPHDYPDYGNTGLPHERLKVVQDEYEETSVAYKAWDASRDRRYDILAPIAVELDSYGHIDGDDVWAVRVKASVQTTSRAVCALEPLVVDPEWPAQLARFMELLELPVTSEPGWHVTVNYG